MGSSSSVQTDEEKEKPKEEEHQSEGEAEKVDDEDNTALDNENSSHETTSEVLLQIDPIETGTTPQKRNQGRRESKMVEDQSYDACDFIIAMKAGFSLRASAPEFEITGKSANEIKKEKEEKKLREEVEKLTEAKRKREEKLVKEERLYSLCNQLEARFGIMQKYEDEQLTVQQDVIDNLSNLVRKFHKRHACEDQLPKLEKSHYILEKKLRRRRRQKEELQAKQLEDTPKRLQQTNPDIDELSSHARAQKLAVQLSELYDRERKQTFTEVRARLSQDVPDTRISICLRDLLLFCFKRCKTKSDRQTKTIMSSLNVTSGVAVKDPMSHTEAINNMACHLLIKEFRKNVTRWSLACLKKEIQHEIYQEKVFDIITMTLRASPNQSHLKHYLDQCIEISWLSQVLHPALRIIYDREPASKVMYNPCTSGGSNISYVLWPALVVPGGKVLVKGVAMFDNTHDPNMRPLKKGPRIVNS